MKILRKILPDFISLAGLAMLGYGLFLFSPRLSFSVIGILLIIYGIFVDIAPFIASLLERRRK